MSPSHSHFGFHRPARGWIAAFLLAILFGVRLSSAGEFTEPCTLSKAIWARSHSHCPPVTFVFCG
jgi:hypothetical protein